MHMFNILIFTTQFSNIGNLWQLIDELYMHADVYGLESSYFVFTGKPLSYISLNIEFLNSFPASKSPLNISSVYRKDEGLTCFELTAFLLDI